jgi:hypothetical protein
MKGPLSGISVNISNSSRAELGIKYSGNSLAGTFYSRRWCVFISEGTEGNVVSALASTDCGSGSENNSGRTRFIGDIDIHLLRALPRAVHNVTNSTFAPVTGKGNIGGSHGLKGDVCSG